MRLTTPLRVSRALLNPSRSIGHFPSRLANYGDIMVAEALHALFSEWTVVECSPNRLTRALDRTLGLRRVFRYSCLGGGTLILGDPQTGWLDGLRFIVRGTVPLFTFGSGVVDPEFVEHIQSLRGNRTAIPRSHIDRWLECLSGFRTVAVRGVESKQILADVGFPGAEVIGDPALFYTRSVLCPKAHRKRIGVNVSTYSHFWNNSQQLVAATISKVIGLLVRDGWSVTLFPTLPEDLLLSEDIRREVGSTHVTVHRALFDIPAWLDAVETLDLFVGVKLHSVITAFSVGTPAIMIGYQPKCLDFMRTLSAESRHLRSDTVSADALFGHILTVYSNLDAVQATQFAAARTFKKRLERFKVDVVRDTVLGEGPR